MDGKDETLSLPYTGATGIALISTRRVMVIQEVPIAAGG